MTRRPCPCCQASRPTAADVCRRCKADLTMVRAVEDAHARRLAAARRKLAGGDAAGAASEAAAAVKLWRSAEAVELGAVAELAGGEFARALALYGRAFSPPVPERGA